MKNKSAKQLVRANKEIDLFMEKIQDLSYKFIKTTAIEYNDYCNDIRQELMKDKLNFDEWFAIYVSNEKKVEKISNFECRDWILNKHYAKRMCSISYAYGLFIDGQLNGVCTFGFPPNYNYNNGKCVFNSFECLTLELNRLVVNEGLPKNTLSYFVSKSLKMLPKPTCIVSYADQNQGHNGYIYQATNWIYTGVSTPKHRYIFEDGSSFDIRRGIDNKGKIVDKVLLKPTHRYLFFNGNKKDIKKMKKDLKLKLLNYPKGVNKRYDASYRPQTQAKLF